MKLILLAVIFLLTACDALPAVGTPTPTLSARVAGSNANATAEYAAAISADSADASQASYAATQQAQRANASAATQATLDAGYIAEQNSRVAVAQSAARKAQNSEAAQATMDAANAISATFMTTSTMVMRAMDVQKAYHQDDFLYQALDWIVYAFPRAMIYIALPVILIIFLIQRGRALGARLDDAIYPRQKALPPPQSDDNENIGNELETGNRVTGNSTVTQAGNSQKNGEMTLNSAQGSGVLHQYTESQWMQLQSAKRDALDLLQRSLEYHRSRGLHDTGQIPRYHLINCKPEWRGGIVNNLIGSGLATKSATGTFVTQIGGETLGELAHRITRNEVRVYPVGFDQLPPEPLDTLARVIKKALPRRETGAPTQ